MIEVAKLNRFNCVTARLLSKLVACCEIFARLSTYFKGGSPKVVLGVLSGCLVTCCNLHAFEKTPSHVFQLTEYILADIKLIREVENIQTIAKTPEVQTNKTPLHVYSKSLEVRTKVIYLQNKYQLENLEDIEIPLKDITPTDVYDTVSELHAAIQQVKKSLGIAQSSDIELKMGKTPANVYENLWQASYYLDALVGAISPDLVYRNVLYAIQDAKALAAKLGVQIERAQVKVQQQVIPKQTNIEGYKTLYRLARLERKLLIDAVAVRTFPSTVITPSDVFDTTNNILAELVRIKIAVNVANAREMLQLTRGKQARDVLQQMRVLGQYLDAIEQHI